MLIRRLLYWVATGALLGYLLFGGPAKISWFNRALPTVLYSALFIYLRPKP